MKTQKFGAIPNNVGDDRGYRYVKVDEDHTPLVVAEIPQFVVYNEGPLPGVSLYPRGGFGTPNLMLLRRPFAEQLKKANERFRALGLKLLGLDGFRSSAIQRNLFVNMCLSQGWIAGDSLFEQFRIGFAADDTVSYANVTVNDAFRREEEDLKLWLRDLPQFAELCGNHEVGVDEGIRILVTIRKNLWPERFPELRFDLELNTAHGNGGAADLWLTDPCGDPTLLGVPFDSPSPAAAFAFFENKENWRHYRKLVEEDTQLQEYLRQMGVTKVTDEVCRHIRDIRRVFYHVMCVESGFTIYDKECWHFNAPGDTSPCSAIMAARANDANVKPETVVARWGSRVAHEMAAALGYP